MIIKLLLNVWEPGALIFTRSLKQYLPSPTTSNQQTHGDAPGRPPLCPQRPSAPLPRCSQMLPPSNSPSAKSFVVFPIEGSERIGCPIWHELSSLIGIVITLLHYNFIFQIFWKDIIQFGGRIKNSGKQFSISKNSPFQGHTLLCKVFFWEGFWISAFQLF